MNLSSQMDRELLRKGTLRFLAERFRLALDVGQIVRLMEVRHYVDVDFDSQDVEQALVVLEGEEFVKSITEQFGATVYYQITGKGIVANERING